MNIKLYCSNKSFCTLSTVLKHFNYFECNTSDEIYNNKKTGFKSFSFNYQNKAFDKVPCVVFIAQKYNL